MQAETSTSGPESIGIVVPLGQPHCIVIGGVPISLCQETEAVYVLTIESEGASTAQGRWEEIDRQPPFGDVFHRNCIPPAVDVSLGTKEDRVR